MRVIRRTYLSVKQTNVDEGLRVTMTVTEAVVSVKRKTTVVSGLISRNVQSIRAFVATQM